MHKNKMLRKLISTVISAAVVLSAIVVPTVTASAATAPTSQGTFCEADCIGSDGKPIKYTETISGNDSINKGQTAHKYWIKDTNKTNHIAFCIESDIWGEAGATLYKGRDPQSTWSSFSNEKKRAINLALLYGYQGSFSSLVGNDHEKFLATQLIIWEFCTDERSVNADKGYKAKSTRYYSCTNNANVRKNYKIISDKLAKYLTLPSFTKNSNKIAPTYTMKWNGSYFTTTLTDTNGILADYNFKSANGVTVTKSGNKLTLKATKPVTSVVSFGTEKNVPTATKTDVKLTVYGVKDRQTTIIGVNSRSDPPRAFFKIQTEPVGNLVVDKTIKSSASGGANGVKTSNFSFNLSGTAKDGTKVNLNATTNASGRATFNNVPVGTYTLKENATNPSNGTNKAETFIMPKPRKVTITKGKTTSLTGKNAMPNEMVEVRVVKRFTDKSGKLLKDVPLKGYTFKLTGTTLYGEKVERTGTSDANGKLTFTNLWKGKYTITEVNSGKAQNCTLPKAKTVTWVATDNSKYKEVSLDNTPKYGSVDLQKLIKTADGANVPDQDLSGFSFNLSGTSDLGIKVNVTKTTDKHGKANFADIPVGNYTLKEIVNEKSVNFKIGLPLNLRVNYDQTTKVTRNNYIPTDVTIFKVDADTHKVITDGVTKLKVCKVTNSGYKDIGVYTTVDGAVEIDDVTLENGKYAIFELEAPDGYVLSSEPTYFEIADGVDENGRNKKAPTVFVGNAPTEVVLEKKSVDGASIPNTLLDVYDDKGELVAEEKTDENGQLVLKNLTAGTYTWKEVEAPDGYAINENVYTFVVNKDGTLTDESVTQMTDEPTKVKVYKVDDTDLPLAGAEFTMYDAEGNVVDTKVTDQDGLAEFIQFVQGKYIIRETKAPKGYLLEDTEFEIYNDGHWDNNSDTAKIKAPNHKLPEIHTTATIDGEKIVNPAETLTIEDVVSCKNLIVGKEYTVPGVIMDKATGEPFMVDGEQVTSEVTFIAEESDCDIIVSFTFDASGITTETNLVVFESLYSDGIELATHADINDEGQTVKIEIPEEIKPEPVPEEVKPAPKPEEVKPAPEPEGIVPKTGDDFALPVALTIILSVALATALVAGRRKKNEQ